MRLPAVIIFLVFSIQSIKSQQWQTDLNFGKSGFAYEISLGVANALIPAGEELLVVGSTAKENGKPCIYKFTKNGKLDTPFYETANSRLSKYPGEWYSVDSDSTGGIYAAGYMKEGATECAYIQKVNAAGHLDSGFGAKGFVRLKLANASTRFMKINIHHNYIYVCGGCVFEADQRNGKAFIARYQANGVLDSSFGINGIYQRNISNQGEIFHAFAFSPEDEIYLAGSCFNGSNENALLSKISKHGKRDSTFNLTGVVQVNPGYDCVFKDILINKKNKLYLCGFVNQKVVGNDPLIGAYNIDGSVNSVFSNTGIKVFNYSNYDDYFYKLQEDSNGNVYGFGSGGLRSLNSRIISLKINSSGVPDLNGIISSDLTDGDENITDFVLNENNIFATGRYFDANGNLKFGLVKLIPEKNLKNQTIAQNENQICYPNPCSREVFVKFKVLQTDAIIQSGIYNLLGQKMEVPMRVSVENEMIVYQYNVSLLSPGTYSLKVQNCVIKVLKI